MGKHFNESLRLYIFLREYTVEHRDPLINRIQSGGMTGNFNLGFSIPIS